MSRKKLKIMLLALLTAGLAAGSAFAGTTVVNHQSAGANYTASLEAMGAARNVTIVSGSGGTTGTAAANKPIAYTLSQNLSSGSLLNVSFTNAGFTGDTIYVCAFNGAAANTTLGSSAPTANSTSASFVLTTVASHNVATGNILWLTSNASCNGAAAGGNVPVQLSSMTSAGSANISMNVSLSGTTVDSNSTATLGKAVQEYTPSVSSADTITIDYLSSTNGSSSGTAFTTGSTGANLIASSNGKVSIAKTSVDLSAGSNGAATASANGGVNAGLTVYAHVELTDTASWSGVNRVAVYVSNSATCNGSTTTWAAGSNAATNSPSSTVALNAPTADFNGSAAANIAVCVGANNSSSLTSRTIAGTYDIVISGTGSNDVHSSSTSATWQTWTPNGYVGLIPWLSKTSSIPTYCLINNAGTSNASMSLDVISNDVSGYSSTSISLGSLSARTSKVLAFNSSGVQLIDSAGTTTTLNDLSGVSFTSSASSRYAAKVSATTGESNVTMSCQQNDPATGGKRLVPVLTGPSASTWRQ